MYEEVAPRRTGAFRDVFLIVIGGFILLSLPKWFPALFDFPYVQSIYEFCVFLAICLLILRFLRSYAVEYKYVLVDSKFIIRSKIGARETVMAEIQLNEESRLIPFAEGERLIKEKGWRASRISFGVSDRKSSYLLIFPQQNGISGIIFQPSAKFVEILLQKGLDKSEKM